MALTAFQRSLCRLIAQSRVASGESYIAGGAALNELLGLPRVSRDVDLFHDTDAALDASWQNDRRLLEEEGYGVRPLRERPAFVEAEVSHGNDVVLLQWVRESAYRFFPLLQHTEFGLTLHPFDLATNKVLALVGRLEVRDWVDVIECCERIQPFGYLAWAACGKDPGFGPAAIIEHAARSHYAAEEVGSLSFAGSSPDAKELSIRWRDILTQARETIPALPAEELGKCVLSRDGSLFAGDSAELRRALSCGEVAFHPGAIRGALPQIVGADTSPPLLAKDRER